MRGFVLQFLRICLVGAGLARLSAQEPGPDRLTFEAAERSWSAGLFERAAQEFTDLTQKFPDSALRPMALERATLARAEAALLKGQWRPAAEAFAAFQHDFPLSTNRPVAAVREAFGWMKAGEPAEVRKRLERSDGPFEMAVGKGEPRGVLFPGWFLLAEARLALGDAVGAGTAAETALGQASVPEERWQVERLRYDVAERTGPITSVVEAAERLRIQANVGTNLVRRAEATGLLARALAASGPGERAEVLWEENLQAGVPAEHQREAILQLAGRFSGRGELVRARQRLERFLTDHATETHWNGVRLALAQVLLRQETEARRGSGPVVAESGGLLSVALGQLARVLTNAPEPNLIGPAQLVRGWCLWEEAMSGAGADRMHEAELAFAAAVVALPAGVEQATARFKLGDTQLSRQDAAGALTNYLAVAEGYRGLAAVDRELRPQAWQQVVTAAVAATNSAAATRGMERLLALSPEAEVVGRSALLVGQSLVHQGQPERGRLLLTAFNERFPESPVTADVRLALATAYLTEQRWTNALQELDGWVRRYTNHPALAQAEFDRAYATAVSGSVTNAVEQFRSLTQRFVTNQLAQTAQLWLGMHFFTQGDYGQAEQAYVAVLTNVAWRGTPAMQQARLLAGQAALARGVTNASSYFKELLNDDKAPEEYRAPAYYHLGEALLLLAPKGTNGPLTAFKEALEAFTGAARYTNNPLVVAAWGRMAYCHVQLASENPVLYERANELYQRIVDAPFADIEARAKAKIWLGQVAGFQSGLPVPRAKTGEIAALREKSLNHFLDVAFGRIRRPGESLPPKPVEEAGTAAGLLLEEQHRWDEAAGLYEQLGRDLPQLKPVWDARRDRVLAARAANGSAPGP